MDKMLGVRGILGVERLLLETLGRRFTHSLINQQHCCPEGKLNNAIHYSILFYIQLKYNLGIPLVPRSPCALLPI